MGMFPVNKHSKLLVEDIFHIFISICISLYKTKRIENQIVPTKTNFWPKIVDFIETAVETFFQYFFMAADCWAEVVIISKSCVCDCGCQLDPFLKRGSVDNSD